MTTKKETAFNQLDKEFGTYSNLVLKQLRLLETILESETGNSLDDQFKEIKSNEKEINKFEVKISDNVINLIVLYSPVATELRQLMAYYRISLNLEKIGDLVTNVIKHLKKVDDPKILDGFSESIGDMLIISINMVEKALLALNNNDMDYAIWTIKNDDLVDDLHNSFIKKIIKKKLSNVKSQSEIKSFINLMNIATFIERLADNATNIAEAAIYASMGKDVRHKNVNLDTLT